MGAEGHIFLPPPSAIDNEWAPLSTTLRHPNTDYYDVGQNRQLSSLIITKIVSLYREPVCKLMSFSNFFLPQRFLRKTLSRYCFARSFNKQIISKTQLTLKAPIKTWKYCVLSADFLVSPSDRLKRKVNCESSTVTT